MVKVVVKDPDSAVVDDVSDLNTAALLSEKCLLRGEYNRQLQVFIESVFETFLLESERHTFLELIQSGEVSFVDLSSGSYKRAYENELLYFREAKIHKGILDKVVLPASPADTGNYPPMLIDVDSGLLIIEGNHRVYKAIMSEESDNNSLFGLRFSSSEAFNHLFNYEISSNKYLFAENGWGETRPVLTAEIRPKVTKTSW